MGIFKKLARNFVRQTKDIKIRQKLRLNENDYSVILRSWTAQPVRQTLSSSMFPTRLSPARLLACLPVKRYNTDKIWMGSRGRRWRRCWWSLWMSTTVNCYSFYLIDNLPSAIEKIPSNMISCNYSYPRRSGCLTAKTMPGNVIMANFGDDVISRWNGNGGQ